MNQVPKSTGNNILNQLVIFLINYDVPMSRHRVFFFFFLRELRDLGGEYQGVCIGVTVPRPLFLDGKSLRSAHEF